MGWAFLPPIQRTLAAPIAPVTRPVEFPGELSAWRSPAFTDSLSHAVVDTSSGGVIDGDGGGLGHPTNTSVHAPELTLLPPAAPDRRAAVGPSGRGRCDPCHGVRVGRRASGSVAHPGTVGRDAARPPRRRRRPDAGAGPGAEAGAGAGPELLNRWSRRSPWRPSPSIRRSLRSAEVEAPSTSADTAAPVDQVVPPLGHDSAASPEPLAPAGRPETVQRSVDAPLAPAR